MSDDQSKILKVIDERDEAEAAISDIYFLVTGISPQWSNNFGYAEAISDIRDAISVLKQSAKNGREG